jgi:hypothetical protein
MNCNTVDIVLISSNKYKAEKVPITAKESNTLCARSGFPVAGKFQTFFTDECFAENIIG